MCLNDKTVCLLLTRSVSVVLGRRCHLYMNPVFNGFKNKTSDGFLLTFEERVLTNGLNIEAVPLPNV